MYLYLSSFLLGSKSRELASLMRIPKVAVIANALDHTAPSIRSSYADGQILEFRQLGFDADELDLREYFDAPRRLPATLDTYGLVWVTGGNVFLLRRAMRLSGFDAHIVAEKKRDCLVYGGFSAGACVTGPTLRGFEIVDDLEATAEGYTDDIIWDGLGLVSYSIAPHYKSDHEDADRVDRLVQYFIDHEFRFITIRDGEAVVTTADA